MKYNPHGDRVRKGWMDFFASGHSRSRGKIVLALLCILTILIMVDAREYVRCDCIYPDELMDLHFSIQSYGEISRNLELRYESSTPLCTGEYLSSSPIYVPIREYVRIKDSYILTAKGRLFSFHRYNS